MNGSLVTAVGANRSRAPAAWPLLAALWLGCSLLPALPHGDVHQQIARVTAEIARHPREAALYLKRGELHRVHGDWDAAYADYDRARQLDPTLDTVDLACGRMFLEAGWPRSAVEALTRYLVAHPESLDAWSLRARAYEKLGRHLAAARDYAAALSRQPKAGPELYIQQARALTAAGRDHWEEALRGLETGIRRLGPLVTLELYALDLEAKLGRYDAALARLDALAERVPRHETWLARRGEILQQAGRLSEAKAAYEKALQALRKLPPARREVPAMLALERRLHQAIERLSASSGSTTRNRSP